MKLWLICCWSCRIWLKEFVLHIINRIVSVSVVLFETVLGIACILNATFVFPYLNTIKLIWDVIGSNV